MLSENDSWKLHVYCNLKESHACSGKAAKNGTHDSFSLLPPAGKLRDIRHNDNIRHKDNKTTAVRPMWAKMLYSYI